MMGFVDFDSLFVNQDTGGGGHCYDSNDPNHPLVIYPFSSPLAPGLLFGKSTTPWDGRTSQPGYEISFDGVAHVGMLPDFVEELLTLKLTASDLQPLWNGAEAYIRAWETADSWKSSFDREGVQGIRTACENARKSLLDGEDRANAAAVVTAMRDLRASHCRAIP